MSTVDTERLSKYSRRQTGAEIIYKTKRNIKSIVKMQLALLGRSTRKAQNNTLAEQSG